MADNKWTRPSYDSRAHSKETRSSAPPDDKTLDPKCQLPFQLIRPQYTKGPLVFRPVPARDYDNINNLARGRESAAQRHYSHFMFPVAAAKYFGAEDQNKFTFLLHQPGDEVGRRNEPYTNFYWACYRANKEGVFAGGRSWDARWNQLMVGSSGKGASITRPTKMHFMQGFVYANGEEEFLGGEREFARGEDPNEPMCVLQLPASADSLFHMFDTPVDSFDGNPDVDFNLPYLFGDPVGSFDPATRTVQGGYFVCCFNPKVTKVQPRSAANPNSPWLASSWNGQLDPKKVAGYEFAISRGLALGGKKIKPSLDNRQVERVVKSSFFWTPSGDNAGILHFPSNEEKCEMIAQAFKSVPKLLEFAWFDRPEYLTAGVRKILGGAKSSVPAPQKTEQTRKSAMFESIDDDTDLEQPTARPANNRTFEDIEENEETPLTPTTPAAKLLPPVDDDEDVVATPVRKPVLDDDDAELSVPAPKARPSLTDDEDDAEEGEAFVEDGDDDDDDLPPPPKNRNAPPQTPAPKPPRRK